MSTDLLHLELPGQHGIANLKITRYASGGGKMGAQLSMWTPSRSLYVQAGEKDAKKIWLTLDEIYGFRRKSIPLGTYDEDVLAVRYWAEYIGQNVIVHPTYKREEDYQAAWEARLYGVAISGVIATRPELPGALIKQVEEDGEPRSSKPPHWINLECIREKRS